MSELKKYCEQQIKELNGLILEAEKDLLNAPKGALRVSCQKNYARYYWKHGDDDSQGDYIRAENIDLAYKLAQKGYLEKLLKTMEGQRSQLRKLVEKADWNEVAKFHETFSAERQRLIKPLILPDKEYAEEWEKKLLEKKKFYENKGYVHYPMDANAGIQTERGEIVRSKSEKIIADKLLKMNIPYIYEMPLLLEGGGCIYPDFTVLNMRKRKVFYWEHFGMMNKEIYSEQAVKKIRKYEKNGIFQGQKLIITYETSTQILNTKELEAFIEEFLL